MAIVEISETLYREINKKFKKKSINILEHLKSLEKSPKKGKILSNVGNILIKEIKYEGFRFYFIVNKDQLNFYEEKELINLIIKFVRMSDKKHQQETINEIKKVLIKIGASGL